MLYSDGVTEAMDAASGERFGVDRLVMRRLGHAVVKHQGDELQDDATQVLVEWKGGEIQRLVK